MDAPNKSGHDDTKGRTGRPNAPRRKRDTATHQLYAGFAGINWDKWDKRDSTGPATASFPCHGPLPLAHTLHAGILARPLRTRHRTMIPGVGRESAPTTWFC